MSRIGGKAESRKREADGGDRNAEEAALAPVLSTQSSVLRPPSSEHLWIPDNPDGSGWADVDWVSAVRGSKYHYRHGEPHDEAVALLPPYYRVVTRLDTELLHAPHENSYYVPNTQLADFLAELILAGGVETIWHIEPCDSPPPESRVVRS